MKKTYIISLLFTLILPFCFMAQTGPGGIGDASTLEVWLDASQLNLSDNDPVSSFTDFSGNNNHAEQGSSSFQPIYKTNQINGNPAIQFDGTNDRLDFISNITNFETTTYTVFNPDNSANHCVLMTQNHYLFFNGANVQLAYNNFSQIIRNRFTLSNNSFVWYASDAGAIGASTTIYSKIKVTSFTRQASLNRSRSVLGSYYTNGNFYNNFFLGGIAEIIVFNEKHNEVQQRIVRNYLNSKYDLNQTPILYDFASTHPSEVIGIGNESSGGNFTARGSGVIQISNASSLDNGDYLLIGHNDAGFATSTSVSSNYIERWSQVWRADLTNTPGTIDIEFFLGANGFASISDYVIAIDSDGDFTSGSTSHSTSGIFSASKNSIKFTGVSLSDGDYFTLAEKDPNPTAIADGDWENTSTWSCACVPDATLDVTIPATFDVTINELADAKSVSIASGGSLTIGGFDTLQVSEGLTINGSFNSGGNGTLIGNGSSPQFFTNSSGSNVSLNHLVANNSSTLFFTGGWTISNSLHASSGTLNVTGDGSVVLLSNASSTAQVLESSGSFTGNFTVQRYIPATPSNYGDISSPITNATVASIDDDLKISLDDGNDGTVINAAKTEVFYSMYEFNRSTNSNVAITSIGTNMVAGVGYEIYLFNSLTQMNDTVIDYVGPLNSGTITPPQIELGWNLVGNPYQSFISFNTLDNSNLTAGTPSYYIFETNLGTYSQYTAGTGPNIAPGQGFWVEKDFGLTSNYTFQESDKVNSTSSTFKRNRTNNHFNLELSNKTDYIKNHLKIDFDYSAIDGKDQFDATFLPSPLPNASEIYSKTAYNDKLIKTTLNQLDESHIIPLELKTGNTGEFNIEAKNINDILENYSCVYLNDKETGKRVDLSLTPNYSFNAIEGISNRFDLVISNSFAACEAKMNESIIQKVNSEINLRESYGDWFLDYNLGELSNQRFKISVYGLNGQLVIPEAEINLSENGTYRLQNLNNLEGIFVIQIIGQEKVINKTIKL